MLNGRILVTGAGGQLGSVLLAQLLRGGSDAVGTVSPTGPRPRTGRTVVCDLGRVDSIAECVRSVRPSRIIHAGAMTSVAACYERPDDARRINADATVRLVELADELSAVLLLTSTDLVFDGSSGAYRETDVPSPVSIYGRSKLAAEQAAIGYPRGVVARLPLMYGLPDVERETTFRSQLASLVDGRPLHLFTDEYRSPLALDDACTAIVTLLQSDCRGLLHCGGPQRLSRFQMGELAAAALGARADLLVPSTQAALGAPEPRPADVSLRSERFEAMFGRPVGCTMAERMPAIAAAFLTNRGRTGV